MEADGRRQRRDRNRDAVVEALLAYYREGDLDPGVQRVAERSGVSHRSVYRYFADVEELTRAAIEHQFARVVPHLPIHGYGVGTLDERIDALVAQRLDLFEAIGNTAVVARRLEPVRPMVAARLRELRLLLREQVATQLGPELEVLGERAPRVVAAADVLCSFESYRLLRDDQGLDDGAVATVLRETLHRLVAPAG